MKKTDAISIFELLLLLPLFLNAQDSVQLKKGDKVRVTFAKEGLDKSLQQLPSGIIEGSIAKIANNKLTLHSNFGLKQYNIPIESITRLKKGTNIKRLTSAGVVIGAGLVLLPTLLFIEPGESYSRVLILGGSVGALIGGGIGYMSHKRKWQTVEIKSLQQIGFKSIRSNYSISLTLFRTSW